MKIWTSEHIFSHPWETVVTAAWRKYPNPMNPAVVGIDVVDRNVQNGVLKTHRLICMEWGLPQWAIRILGADKTCFASEHSEVDPTKKIMTMQSKNLTFCNEISIMEKLTYSPHPMKPESTLLKQEAVITVHGVPLSSYFEDFISKTVSVNANKGRLAMEWVIGKINSEVHELTNKTVKSVDELTASAKRCISEDLKSPQFHFQTRGS
ncbi:protein slowmo-like protein [Leptotrombidium deliense]|uniref:Protein slowmo-like protein n=1 Tax=Leptotrombidium deliense TaxID=299467 RepID=A0A443SJL2_9ACAR|nr:protein slowmo-like protein [Leptotrombidium deliense]